MAWTYMHLQKRLNPISSRGQQPQVDVRLAEHACLESLNHQATGSSLLEDLRQQRLRFIYAVGRTGLQITFL